MRLFVVGIGPGKPEGMTEEARLALEQAEVIAGYTAYIKLVQPLFPEKDYLVTPMRSETERCKLALQAAKTRRAAMVCSGDAGVYGMAGLLYELAADDPETELCVIPGITAAQSGAALLGAPLMQDYAVISLSDLLVPWETIEKRLMGAAIGDFVTVLYNPASSRRKNHLRRACEIFIRYRPTETVCGVAQNIGRQGETSRLLPLGELMEYEADMFTTVFIGNSKTIEVSGKMVTYRGYACER